MEERIVKTARRLFTSHPSQFVTDVGGGVQIFDGDSLTDAVADELGADTLEARDTVARVIRARSPYINRP